MSYLLLTLLLLPLVGSGLAFAWKHNSSKYLALGIALIQMLVTFYAVSDFNFTPTVDSVLQYEINYPWSQFIKSSLHFGIDGMSMLLLLLTNILTPIIILSSFNEKEGYKWFEEINEQDVIDYCDSNDLEFFDDGTIFVESA